MSGRVHQEDEDKLRAKVKTVDGSTTEVTQNDHSALLNRAQIIDENDNILDLVKEEDNLSASKHGMPVYAGDDSAPTRKWRAIRCDDHGRQEIHLTNVDHDEQFDFRNKDFDTGVGTEKVSVVGLALPAAGGSAIGGTAANPVRTDPTGTTTQPISGSITGAVTANAGTNLNTSALATSAKQLADGHNVTVDNVSITINKGEPAYTPVKKTGFYTTQQTDTILWDPTAGKKFVITDIVVSVGTAMAVHLEDGTTKIWGWDFAANGGAVINLQTPDESSTADNNLTITMGASGKCSIKVLGYEV